MEFKEWLYEEERKSIIAILEKNGYDPVDFDINLLIEAGMLQKGKDWLRQNIWAPATLAAATTFGGGKALAQDPTQVPQQPQAVTAQAPQEKEDLSWLRSLMDEANKQMEEDKAYRAKRKIPLTKEDMEKFLTNKFRLSPGDIKWVVPSQYLAKYYGQDWQKALEQAQSHQGKQTINWDSLNKPVPVIQKSPPRTTYLDAGGKVKTAHGGLGQCDTQTDAFGRPITFCWVPKLGTLPDDPLGDLMGHEVTHAAQEKRKQAEKEGPFSSALEARQKLIQSLSTVDPGAEELYDYMSKDTEFGAWLGQVKRWYHKETGKIAGANSAKEVMELIKNRVEKDGGIDQAMEGPHKHAAIFYYMYQQAEKMGKGEEFLNLMNDFLGGIVKIDPQQYRGQTDPYSPVSKPMQVGFQQSGLT